MKRYGLAAFALLALAWAIAAVATDSPSLDISGSSATASVSPPCLPTSVDRTARLAGTDVAVSPAPETDTASPHTQISFLGTPVGDIHDVSVIGQRSGEHAGSLRAYSQGDGASFVPDAPFDAGEQVVVQASIAPGPAGSVAHADQEASAGQGAKQVSFAFRVDTPYPTAGVAAFPNPPADPADYQSFDTLPGVQAPVLSITVPDRDPGAGDILTTNGPGPGRDGPLIYTPQGRLVWFAQLPAGETAENLSEQTYEGRRDLTWWKGRVLSLGFGQGEDIVMDSSYRTVARVLGGNGLKADLHDFQLAPHDVAYITAFNPIRCNLTPVKGAADGAIVDTAIQEIDMHTGLVRWEWHSLDHVAAADSEVEAPTDTTPWDWFHVNSIDLEPGGNIFISARSTWAGYQLEGATGKVLWRLGGNHSSFEMGPGTRTAWQHDGRILPDGEITFFDDGSNPPIHRQSRAIRVALDLQTHEARLVSSYAHADPPLLAASQGNVQTLADENAVVGYGGVPAISEYAPSGTLLFDAHLPFDMSFYRAFRFPWRGHPSSPPAVLASLNNTGEETIVHASWNGATDVAAWRVLASKGSAAPAPQATIVAADFESSTTLPARYTRVVVQALDAAGHVLAVSPTVQTIGYAASLPGHGGSG
jgi:Arylsulfotransferase (ASST)